jgi:hypothetical protein
MLKGYWQIELDKESCHLFSFITPDGVFTPKRLMMGATDSGLYFQAKMSKIFSELIQKQQLLLWIDDAVVYAKTFKEFIHALHRFLELCAQYKLTLNIDKTVIIDEEVVWCGHRVTAKGVVKQPRAYMKFTDVAEPKFAGELGEFLHALRWMQGSLLRFQERSQDLWDIFQKAKETLYIFKEDSIDKARSMKKRNYEKVRLSEVGWNAVHSEAFKVVKQMLSELITTSHLEAENERYTTCVFTDASKRHHGAMLTQVLDYDPLLPIEEQDHEPLGILNGEFTKIQTRWSVIEREAYPLIVALREWREAFMASKGIRIYTDHANLASLFRPEAVRSPELSVTAVYKIYRWLYDLVPVRMLCMEHLPGIRNRWADLISRWGHPTYHEKKQEMNIAKLRHLRKRKAPKVRGKHFINAYLKLKAADKCLGGAVPSLELIKCAQNISSPETDSGLTDKDKNMLTYSATEKVWRYKTGGPYWLPSNANELILRCLITAHVSASGHRTKNQTLNNLKHHVWWKTMQADVEGFVNECLSCERTALHTVIPRPWGFTAKATERFEILHFDFLFIAEPGAKDICQDRYILVLKDDYSSYVELSACESADHRPAAEGIALWCARHPAPRLLVSDRGSHFKNQVVAELVLLLPDSYHHFTLAYTPWSNGTVERANREIVIAFQRLLQTRKVKLSKWAALLPAVEAWLNRMPSTRLGKLDGQMLTPLMVFAGTSQNENAFKNAYHPLGWEKNTLVSAEEIAVNFANVLQAIRDIHENVVIADARRDKSNRVKTRNAVEFCVGEFVLYAKVLKHKHKLQAVWKGPYRVKALINEHLCEIEHLVTEVLTTAHVSRLKFYADASLDVSCELQTDIEESEQLMEVYEIDSINDIQYDSDSKCYFALIMWKGFDEAEQQWEDLRSIHEDVPQAVLKYVERLPQKEKDHIYEFLKIN